MTVYIEYAFLQNFVFDGVLFLLALFALREKLCLWRILLSSALGGIFAILFPLIKLPAVFKTLLKFAGGALLCIPLVSRLKTAKEWGRYAYICLFFFAFTFLFGGSLLGVYTAPVGFWKVLMGFSLLSFVSIFLM
ncbi:MAG: sigma-E processing peptidase SpoIIGA, partial [Clostridia bacterium]|nr:sigma-E processing peptidase SpoIIGA [Clostridia bacterium]